MLNIYWGHSHSVKATKSTELHFACDTYRNQSIKNAERNRQAEQGYQTIKRGDDQRTSKQWRKLLACEQNIENVLEYLFQCWSTSAKTIIEKNNYCWAWKQMSYNKNECEKYWLHDLETIQEEADTRLMLHAAKYSNDLVIRSPNADVFVLALAFCSQNDGHLYFHTLKGRNPYTIIINHLQYMPILAKTNEMPLLVCMLSLDVTLWVLCMGFVKQKQKPPNGWATPIRRSAGQILI